MTNTQTPKKTEPVNRTRRSRFIFIVVAYCLLISTGLVTAASIGYFTDLTLIQTFVGSLINLAIAVSLGYVGASSADYNGGIVNMFRGNGNNEQHVVLPPPDSGYTPAPATGGEARG